MKREVAKRVKRETEESYNAMAKEFSLSRAQFWEELDFLADHIERDDHVLDIGCGNGRFLPLVLSRHAHYDGVDYSEGLIKEAKQKYPEHSFTQGDATALHNFHDNSFDIAFSFAMMHHIPSIELRKKCISEMYRVLHPGGKLIITAWNIWSPRYFGKLFASAVRSLLGMNGLDVGDVMLTFGQQKQPRYIHAFTMSELNTLLTEGGFTVLDEDTIARKSGQKNFVIVAQKS